VTEERQYLHFTAVALISSLQNGHSRSSASVITSLLHLAGFCNSQRRLYICRIYAFVVSGQAARSMPSAYRRAGVMRYTPSHPVELVPNAAAGSEWSAGLGPVAWVGTR
jgi:hypothetical protein